MGFEESDMGNISDILTGGYNSIRRRTTLLAVGGMLSLPGCLTNGDSETERRGDQRTSGSESPTQSDEQQSQTTREGPVQTTEVASQTESPTDTVNMDTGIPPETPRFNETDYPVGYPWAPFGEPYLENPSCLLEDISVTRSDFLLLDTLAEWKRLITQESAFSAYPFVTETDFDSSSIIVFETRITRGMYLETSEINGVSDGDISVVLHEAGKAVVNAEECFSVLIRLPINKSIVNIISIKLIDKGGNSNTLVKKY
jgi:hypothetical protein